MIDALLDRVEAGESPVAVLWGEPGIGKTALLADALAKSARRGFAPLSGRAAEYEQDLPFAVFAAALERDWPSVAIDRLGLDPQQRSALAGVLPFVEPLDGGQGAAAGTVPERHQVLRGMHGLLDALASERPLVLALDDLHWADPASVDLVSRLLHRGLGHPALLLLALRPGQTETRLRNALWEAERHGHVRWLELQPLSSAAADALLDGIGSPALRQALYRESGGNPLYLEQLAAVGERDLPAVAGAIGVPAAVAAAIRAETEALAPVARALLDGAAVAGDPFDPPLAAEAAGLAPADALPALDELVESDLIRPADAQGRFHFRHPIVRHAVYQGTGAGWRLGAHGRVATALAARGAPAALRASHVERSAVAGDEAAVSVLTDAAREALPHAPASAARWFAAALRLLDADERHLERRLSLAGQRAAALGIAGHLEEGLDALDEFLALSPVEPTVLRLRVAVFAAIFNELLGRQETGRRVLLDELGRLGDPAGPDAAELQREVALSYFFDADWDRMRTSARTALACACEGMVRVGALSALALAEFGRHDHAAFQAATDAAGALFDAVTDEEIAAHHPGMAGFLGWAEVCGERYEAAIAHVERALTVSRRAGQRHLSIGLLLVKTQALATAGRLEELGDDAERATEDSLLSNSTLLRSWAMTIRCQAALLRGDLHEAVRFGERGAAAAEASSSPLSGIVRVQLAEALLEAGEPARCWAELTDAEGHAALPPFPLYEARCFELLTRAALARSDRATAETCARRAELVAGRSALALPRAQAGRARAAVELARGDHAAAAATGRAAVLSAERAGAPIDAARARLLVGRALAAGSERAAAIAELETARDQLASRRANCFGDQAERELRRLGRAVARRSADPAHPLGLTEREIEVIDRVAAGRTNREIADELVLSVRTVDRHVARIFEKLGVKSRVAAVGVYERARGR